MTTNDSSAPSPKRLPQPSLKQGVTFGTMVGAAYAIGGSAYVLLNGGIPQSWGHATMPRVILVELAGGAVAGGVVSLLSPLARFWLGAVLVASAGLSPLLVGVAVLVDGPSRENVIAALGAASLIGLGVGTNLWKNDSRYWRRWNPFNSQ